MSNNSLSDMHSHEKAELPNTIRLLPFAAARCQEINAMKGALSTSKKTKLIFQKLPVHMRRRVMSHSVKRLPRRLREGHLSQLKKSGLPPKQKRPSRKYRRRPRNLLVEYNRRQRKFKWLETHIWHAKRFHMVERWGYKIPYSPCDKAFRACYRATAKHCLIQDMSYYGCIEIKGDEQCIIENFKKVYDANVNLSIGAKAFIRGNREGTLTLFDDLKKPIGTVSFNWKPNVDNQLRTLWIWTHPANFSDILATLIKLFDLSPNNDVYLNESNQIILCDLRYKLNRFRLTGPLSHAVLQKSLRCISNLTDTKSWLSEYTNNSNKSLIDSQISYWNNIKNLSSPSELSPHIILSIIAEDPRYNMPRIRTKGLPCNGGVNSRYLYDLPENMGAGPIWESDIREKVQEKQMATSEIYKMRSKFLIPESSEEIIGMPVPYLLIQRPGKRCDKLGYCSGWDIVMPSGWALPTWLTLIMWGARAGGLRETESIQFEMGRLHYLEPDTSAGKQEEQRLEELYRLRYTSLPPNRRTNYTKYAIVSPYSYNWNTLLKDWCENSPNRNDFYVLRNKKILQELQDAILARNGCNTFHINIDQHCLVPIKITMEKKGVPARNSLICLPFNQDLNKSALLKEPRKADPNQSKRKTVRKEHMILLRKMKRARMKARKDGEVIKQDNTEVIKYRELMEKLWIPDVKNIRNSCSREIMGFVTKGGFSYTVGQAIGVGYITMNSLKKLLLQNCKNKVLIRNTSSRLYRVGKIEIVTS